MAIDRRNGTEVAMETVKLAEEFMLSSDGLVVGLDLSGDPMVRSFVCQMFTEFDFVIQRSETKTLEIKRLSSKVKVKKKKKMLHVSFWNLYASEE